MNKTKIYFDMDGTLAEWRPASSMEELLTPGYFASLAPHRHVVTLAKEWLAREFGDLLSELTIVFVPCGANKSHYVDAQGCVLLDDHSPNLWQWYRAGGVAVKALNQINGSGRSWKYARIDVLSPISVASFLALVHPANVRVAHAPIRMPRAICLEAPVK